MKQINWNTTLEEDQLIGKIVDRALKSFTELNYGGSRMDLNMDITATHCNGTPLDLEKFLQFDEFNFAHDLFGIINNINRETGELDNCFLPRCSK